MSSSALTELASWQALEAHARELEDLDLRDCFAEDAERFETFSVPIEGMLYDYSKSHVQRETMALLATLLKERDFEAQREALFTGAHINNTEGRAALHTALRDPGCDLEIDGEAVGDFVQGVLDRLHHFSAAVRKGDYKGLSGKTITDVVNIGIGGSDLGPRVVSEALAPYAEGDIRLHFVSNIDARHLFSVLEQVDPASTLFVVASKTFSTQETMTNAVSAKEWLIKELDARAVARHFVAVTSNREAALEFGIEEPNIFPLRPWIGGRYSLWSAIGLPLCLALGYKNFYALLQGAHAMDRHFRAAEPLANIPVLMALLSVWNINFREHPAQAALPYAYDLRGLPDYLQQLEMESNGKRVTKDGESCDYATAPVVFGEQGPNGQHAFYQALHQGSAVIPCDFIGIAKARHSHEAHHEKLLANMIGQARALMEGRDNPEEPHRHFPGNKPSTTLLLERLDPYHLGMLLAAYEHKVFVEGVIWGINSFDQWGVELGKALTNEILSEQATSEHDRARFDGSTQGLLNSLERMKRM